MRMRALLLGVMPLFAAGALVAQDTHCELVRSVGTTRSFNVGTPYQVDHIPHPDFACRGADGLCPGRGGRRS